MDGVPYDCMPEVRLRLRPGRQFDRAGPAYTRTGVEVPVPFVAPTGEWGHGDLQSTAGGSGRCWFANGAYLADGTPSDLDLFNVPLSERPGSVLPDAPPTPRLPPRGRDGDSLRRADAITDALDDALVGEDAACAVLAIAALYARAVHRSEALGGDVDAAMATFVPIVRDEVAELRRRDAG